MNFVVAAIACGAFAVAAVAQPVITPCEQAAVQAEQASGLPPGLLRAIGTVESGRWDALLGRRTPWPWSINAAGQGQQFGSKDQAIRETAALWASGQRAIDVGCFQINLRHHPAAFTGLEQAFDPTANGLYAARFLNDLRGRLGSWDAAVASYHSADPARGEAYRQLVFASWTTPANAIVPAPPWTPPETGIRIWTPSPEGTAPNVVKVGRGAMPAAIARTN